MRLLAFVASCGLLEPSLAAQIVINALHHNPHWECFSEGNIECQTAAWDQFNHFLDNYDVDFASLVMGGDYKPKGHQWSVNTSVSHYDKAALVWNNEKWKLLDSRPTEFEVDRAVMLGHFQAKHDESFTLVVGSFHYPHGNTKEPAAEIGRQIASLWGKQDQRVLLLADTNRLAVDIDVTRVLSNGTKQSVHYDSDTSQELVEELGIPHESVQTTKPLRTCCGDWKYSFSDYPDWEPYYLTFDRIFTNFNCKLETVEDKKYNNMTYNYTETPPWAKKVVKFGTQNATAAYHHPVMARITMPKATLLV